MVEAKLKLKFYTFHEQNHIPIILSLTLRAEEMRHSWLNLLPGRFSEAAMRACRVTTMSEGFKLRMKGLLSRTLILTAISFLSWVLPWYYGVAKILKPTVSLNVSKRKTGSNGLHTGHVYPFS